ncbi:MAG: metallophosphoesterase [Pirellulales bacterium]
MSGISRREALKTGAALSVSPVVAAMLGSATRAYAADPYADAQLVAGEPPQPAKGSFTVAVLPDTQNYSERYPQTYLAQTNWILENQKDRNIACVLHLGDITNNNAVAEWQNARQAMQVLDGKLPYTLVPGNHDYSDGGVCQDRGTLLNDYFPVGQYRGTPGFGGTYDKEPQRLENSYSLFSAEGRNFLVLNLEFGPRRDVIRWANEVVAQHQDRAAILVTHAYMYYDDTRYDWKKYGDKQSWNPHNYAIAKATGDDVADGEELWNGLVARQPNFVLTLNGHVLKDGLGRTVTAAPGNREIPQVLVNFQMKPKGGDGWLRLLEFKADGKTVQTYDYSPTRNERNESPQNQFVMQLPGVA